MTLDQEDIAAIAAAILVTPANRIASGAGGVVNANVSRWRGSVVPVPSTPGVPRVAMSGVLEALEGMDEKLIELTERPSAFLSLYRAIDFSGMTFSGDLKGSKIRFLRYPSEGECLLGTYDAVNGWVKDAAWVDPETAPRVWFDFADFAEPITGGVLSFRVEDAYMGSLGPVEVDVPGFLDYPRTFVLANGAVAAADGPGNSGWQVGAKAHQKGDA